MTRFGPRRVARSITACCKSDTWSPEKSGLVNGGLVAAVQSDIVGYTTMTMEAGKWYMVGTPFVALENNVNETNTINDVFVTGFSQGDILNVLDTKTSQFIPHYWNATKSGWTTSRLPSAELAETPLCAGQGVYIQKKTPGVLTFSGKVEITEVQFGMESGEAWSQVVSVWPEVSKLNDLKWEGMAKGDILNLLDEAQQRFVPYYWNETKGGWSSSRLPSAALTEDVVAVGKAMYINKKSAGIATLTR